MEQDPLCSLPMEESGNAPHTMNEILERFDSVAVSEIFSSMNNLSYTGLSVLVPYTSPDFLT